MGHVNFKDCAALAALQGIKLSNTANPICEVCQVSKQRKRPISDLAERRDVAPGEILHCDIKGPLDSAYNRSKYALVVVDEATRIYAAKEMKTKDQVVDALKSIVSSFSRLPGKKIIFGEGSTLHSDSEAVLKSKNMSAYLEAHRISARASPPHTHERNGIVERAIQTIFDTTRALLQQGQLEDKFWPVAMHHAVYLRNRSPTQALGGSVPLKELNGSLPSLSKLRKFGCKAFVKVDDSARRALDPKARPGIYVGHSELSDSFRVMVRNTNRWDIVDTIHCTFHESDIGNIAAASLPASAPEAASQTPTAPARREQPLLAERDPLLDYSDDEPDDQAILHSLVLGGSSAPNTYHAAMRDDQSTQWTAAVKSEVESLTNNGTFELVPEALANGHKVLSSRWIFAKKPEADGSTRFKARLVARGDHQRAGIDFDQVYAPVVNANTVRTLLAVAAVQDFELDQMDAVTAFLNAPLEEELYLRIPDGFTEQPGKVLRLKKSLYGLKQAPRYWNKMLHDWLISKGLQQSEVDSCLYFIPGKLWVAFWVDDFLVMSRDVATKQEFKTAISQHFKMRDLGALNQFLGMHIERDRARRVLTIRSTKHIDDMLERFGMSDAKPVATPLPPKSVLRACTDENERLSTRCPYRAIVGSLLYVSTWTRPDISFAVSQVARFQQSPSNHHWQCAKHILRYLKGTRDFGLSYSAGESVDRPLILRGFVDASWGEDLDTRRSQSGYLFTLGNATISWNSKLQTTVALSSTEAEYLALSSAVKEALSLCNLLRDIWPDAAANVTLFEDNQSTIKQASNLQSSDRTKHVDIRHHFIKHHVANGDIALEYLPTADQPADALTKNLDRIKVSSFRQVMLGRETTSKLDLRGGVGNPEWPVMTVSHDGPP